MTVERALNILELQLAAVLIDGNRETIRKRNYIDALKVAIRELKKIVYEGND